MAWRDRTLARCNRPAWARENASRPPSSPWNPVFPGLFHRLLHALAIIFQKCEIILDKQQFHTLELAFGRSAQGFLAIVQAAGVQRIHTQKEIEEGFVRREFHPFPCLFDRFVIVGERGIDETCEESVRDWNRQDRSLPILRRFGEPSPGFRRRGRSNRRR